MPGVDHQVKANEPPFSIYNDGDFAMSGFNYVPFLTDTEIPRPRGGEIWRRNTSGWETGFTISPNLFQKLGFQLIVTHQKMCYGVRALSNQRIFHRVASSPRPASPTDE